MKKNTLNTSRAKKKIEITIILSAFKRWDLLKNAMQQISEQDYPSEKWELIVIDDANASQNKQVVESFSKKIKNLVFISEGHRGAAKARIIGFKRAQGDIIAFTDEDTLPQTDWLTQIKKAFDAHPEAMGIEGKVISNQVKPLFSNAPENLHGGVYIGCNTHYRRSILEKVQYYDPEFYFWREDTDLAFKVLTHGKIIFVPQVIMHHPPKAIPPISLWNNLYHLKDDMLLYRRFPGRTVSFLGKEWASHAAIAALAILPCVIGFVSAKWMGLALGIWIYFIFRFILNLRKKTFTIHEGVQFLALIFIRDVVFPFFFLYYFISVNLFNIPDFSPRTHQ